MTKRIRTVLALGAMMALAGCATAIPPVQVTRFHLNQPIPPAPAYIDPFGAAGASLEFQTYANAVQGELGRLGFAAGPRESAEYIAILNVTRDTREALARRNPISVGIGGGTGGYGGGVGLGVGFSFGGRQRGEVITELSIQLRRRQSPDVVWEGRAQLEARSNAPAAQPGIAAGKLASALFRDFPGVSGRTISVR